MNVLIALEAHFFRTPDGSVWTQAVFEGNFWERYLRCFDDVTVLARVSRVAEPGADWRRADGPRVSFFDLPDYHGPGQYLLRSAELNALAREATYRSDCAILRVPGAVGTLAWKALRGRTRPFALEVVGDPWDSLAPGTVRSFARPAARFWATRNLVLQCKEANLVSYVTSETLQRRYPAGGPSTHYSTIRLDEDALSASPKTSFHSPKRLIHVGSMETMYKAQDVLIRAFAECLETGLDLQLDLIGDGKCRPRFSMLVEKMGLANRVRFLGMLPGPDAVREHLDHSDLFVLPSLVEGLPRAMIEAMARGLPCLGSSVGGIPELLEHDELVPPRDARALAGKLSEVLMNEQRMAIMAARNLHKAAEYRASILDERRTRFYGQLRGLAGAR